MTDSPFRISLAERSKNATTTAIEECMQPSSPLSFNLSWKTPFTKKLISSPQRQGCEDDEDTEGESSALPSLPPLSWRTPLNKADSPLQEEEEEDDRSIDIPPQCYMQEPGPCSSLAIDIGDDEGFYELESVLLVEEEYSIPEYSRHRKLTGLDCLDDKFGLESHSFVKEEDGQKGLVCGSTLEVAGTPMSGKTTLLIQMAVRERLDSLCRAKERSKGKQKADGDDNDDWLKSSEWTQQVLLIDTEGSMGMDRIVSVAKRHIEQLDPCFLSNSEALLRSVLAGIHYCRCTSEVELLALFQTLLPSIKRNLAASMHPTAPNHLEGKMQFTPRLPMRTTMILIDTISYHMRASISDEARHLRNQRNLLIYEFKHFAERCRRKGINLILANQMGFTIVNKEGSTTSFSDKNGEGRLIPLLRNQNESILGPNEWRLLLFRSHHKGNCDRFAYFIGQPVLIGPGGEPEIPSSTWLPFTVDQGGVCS